MSEPDFRIVFKPNVHSLEANSKSWMTLAIVLAILCAGAALTLPGELARVEDPVETYSAFILCQALGIPMIIFSLRRSLRLRRAAREDADVTVVLSPERLEYHHPASPVSVAWSDIIDPLDAASHLRRRDGGASLLLIRKDAATLSRSTLRRLRKAHRQAILAPTSLQGAIHIPLRFLDAKAADTIRNEAARYWKGQIT